MYFCFKLNKIRRYSNEKSPMKHRWKGCSWTIFGALRVASKGVTGAAGPIFWNSFCLLSDLPLCVQILFELSRIQHLISDDTPLLQGGDVFADTVVKLGVVPFGKQLAPFLWQTLPAQPQSAENPECCRWLWCLNLTAPLGLKCP